MFFVKSKKFEKVILPFEDYFQTIPKTGFENQTFDWFSTDVPERNFNVPYANAISYKFNSYGYRCDEFVRKDINVLTIGCSMTFGNAIPVENRFSNLICRSISEISGLKVANWNMAWPGSSGDYCSRILLLCFDYLMPDMVLVNFPYSGRLEYFNSNGRLYDYRPLAKPIDAIENSNKKMIKGLSNNYQSTYRFFKNYKIIEKTVGSTPWLFSLQREDCLMLEQHVNQRIFVKPLEKVDTGRDGGHPGVESNKNHSESYLDKIKELYSDVLNGKR